MKKCRYCNQPEDSHGRRWSFQINRWHTYQRPTLVQVLQRSLRKH